MPFKNIAFSALYDFGLESCWFGCLMFGKVAWFCLWKETLYFFMKVR
jgi:hypothetical protein